MWRTDSLEKTLMLGGIEGRRRGDDRGWGGWMASSSRWTWVWVNSGSWWWARRPGVLQSIGLQRRTRMNDWTELNLLSVSNRFIYSGHKNIIINVSPFVTGILNNIPSYDYIILYPILSPFDGHLDYLYFLTIMNNCGMKFSSWVYA